MYICHYIVISMYLCGSARAPPVGVKLHLSSDRARHAGERKLCGHQASQTGAWNTCGNSISLDRIVGFECNVRPRCATDDVSKACLFGTSSLFLGRIRIAIHLSTVRSTKCVSTWHYIFTKYFFMNSRKEYK